MVNGRLKVFVGQGRRLKDMDLIGKMDPYAIVEIASQRQRTSTKRSAGRDPTWNEEMFFDVHDHMTQTLLVTVMDEDVGKDDFVGQLELPFADMIKECRGVDSWYGLKGKDGNPCGEIQLKLTYIKS